MKHSTITICTVIVLFSCNNESKQPAEAKVAAAATISATTIPDTATLRKNRMAYMTPGEAHALMASWNGTWTGDVTMWEAPGAQPLKSTATAVNKMIMGGRYQQSSFKGRFNNQLFEGQSTLAYDNARKLYISTWIDNMGTGIAVSEGPWDAASKSITLRGRMVDPGTGKETEIREVFKPIDNNYQVMEMYAVAANGKEFKTMEIKYTRKN